MLKERDTAFICIRTHRILRNAITVPLRPAAAQIPHNKAIARRPPSPPISESGISSAREKTSCYCSAYAPHACTQCPKCQLRLSSFSSPITIGGKRNGLRKWTCTTAAIRLLDLRASTAQHSTFSYPKGGECGEGALATDGLLRTGRKYQVARRPFSIARHNSPECHRGKKRSRFRQMELLCSAGRPYFGSASKVGHCCVAAACFDRTPLSRFA